MKVNSTNQGNFCSESFHSIGSDEIDHTVASNLDRSGGRASEKENRNPQPSTSKMVRTSSSVRKQSAASRNTIDSEDSGDEYLPDQREKTQKNVVTKNKKKGPKPTGAAKRKNNTPCQIEIHHLQSTTHNIIPNAPFCRLLREIIQQHGHFRITREAIEALRESSEVYTVNILEDAYKITGNRKQVTLQPRDIHLLMLLRGNIGS